MTDQLFFNLDGIKYSVTRDSYCWMLQSYAIVKEGKNLGKEYIDDTWYYTNFNQIANKLLEMPIEIGNQELFNASVERIATTLASYLYVGSAKIKKTSSQALKEV